MTEPSEETARPVPVPPRIESVVQDAQQQVADATAAITDAVAQQVATAEAEITAAQSEVMRHAASLIGQADSELRQAVTPSWRAIDRLTDSAYKELVYAEEELKAQRVAIPRDTDAKVAALSDTSGDTIIAMLMPSMADAPPALGEYNAFPGPASGASYSPSFPTESSGTDSDSPSPMSPPASPPSYPESGAPELPTEHACGCTVPAPVVNLSCPAPVVTLVSPPPVPPVVPPVDTSLPPTPSPPFSAPEEPLSPLASPPAPPESPPTSAPTSAPKSPGVPFPHLTLGSGPAWAKSNACEQISHYLKFYRSTGSAEGVAPDDYTSAVSQVYRAAVVNFKSYADYVFSGFDTKVKDEAQRAYTALTSDILGGYSSAVQLYRTLGDDFIPDKRTSWNIALKVAQANKSEADTGLPMSYLTQSLTYLMHASAPQFIPSQAELNGLYLSDQLTAERWACLTAANGNIPDLASMVVAGSQTRPNVHEIIELYNRGSLDPRWTLEARLREQGVLDRGYLSEFYALSQFVPGPSDLVRYMVRDALDDAVVKKYAYDSEFEEKFYGAGGRANPGPAAKWAMAQGVSEDVMRREWYSHWKVPSDTQLYEMIYRLREDRPEVREYDKVERAYATQQSNIQPGVRPVTVTPDDARELLKINDLAPGWVERILAIASVPITRTDIIDGWMNGALTDEQFVDRVQDQRYTRSDAEQLLKNQKAKRASRIANQSGVWTPRKIISAYMNGTMTGAQADALLQPLVLDPQVRQSLIQGADMAVTAKTRDRRIARVKRGYFVGAYTDEQAHDELTKGGIDPLRVPDLIRQWSEDVRGRFREPAAKQLVQWAQLGLIDANDMYQRLLRLGWDSIDAERIVYQGLHARNREIQGEAARLQSEARQLIRDAKAARRADDKELQDRLSEIEKAQKAWSDERKRIEREQDKRRNTR